MLFCVRGLSTTPIEPPPTPWRMPSVELADEQGLVAIGADLEPATLLAAYRSGLFPMPLGRRDLGWWSPDPRGVMPIDGMHISRSLRRSIRRYTTSVDSCFGEVMIACGDPRRPNGWINDAFVDAYTHLHRLGWAHSVETFDDAGALVGGVYGVRIGRFFAGESMFSTAADASKVAVARLVDELREAGVTLFDVQWTTDHLASLGVVDVPRAEYLRRLRIAVGDER